MLKLFGIVLSLFLIFIIFVRTPDDSAGLSSFEAKTDLLGSPRSARRFLDFLTTAGVILYLIIAFKLNVENR